MSNFLDYLNSFLQFDLNPYKHWDSTYLNNVHNCPIVYGNIKKTQCFQGDQEFCPGNWTLPVIAVFQWCTLNRLPFNQ